MIEELKLIIDLLNNVGQNVIPFVIWYMVLESLNFIVYSFVGIFFTVYAIKGLRYAGKALIKDMLE